MTAAQKKAYFARIIDGYGVKNAEKGKSKQSLKYTDEIEDEL